MGSQNAIKLVWWVLLLTKLQNMLSTSKSKYSTSRVYENKSNCCFNLRNTKFQICM